MQKITKAEIRARKALDLNASNLKLPLKSRKPLLLKRVYTYQRVRDAR